MFHANSVREYENAENQARGGVTRAVAVCVKNPGQRTSMHRDLPAIVSVQEDPLHSRSQARAWEPENPTIILCRSEQSEESGKEVGLCALQVPRSARNDTILSCPNEDFGASTRGNLGTSQSENSGSRKKALRAESRPCYTPAKCPTTPSPHCGSASTATS